MEPLKAKDSVQLMHGFTPTMTISEINDDSQKALCVWYDSKSRNVKSEWIPLNVLKLTPEKAPISAEQIISALRR